MQRRKLLISEYVVRSIRRYFIRNLLAGKSIVTTGDGVMQTGEEKNKIWYDF